ncbi:nucleotide exchange factor GrpE [Candidatus Kaiserbacteria bacterium RIFCSPHIGHO2_02_FULL_49_34]|uniref:Protein GrpE n=1 Tax=Candidatus Kaiserbacteria bacterium RIFCSPHIGHO2_02_FULL_49_34 TaxID=1798491 RepID=A0A1F6DLN7_9BACT|nr:MAG: nucleotide exchange factor GrpE [Candidatus Kaiserbacteria bacterium RIFCSPHIGHO2_02_FULL_49_34]
MDSSQKVDAEMAEEYVAEADEIEISEDGSEATFEQKIKHWRDKFKQCDSEKRQAMEDLQRGRAEFLNAKRMQDEQAKRERDRAVERVMEDLLPLADSFDMALTGKGWDAADANWKKGIEGIRAQLQALLTSHGVETIEATNVPFDPNQHEAVMQEVREGVAPDTVLSVLQKGYKRKDFIIRPAKVTVSN